MMCSVQTERRHLDKNNMAMILFLFLVYLFTTLLTISKYVTHSNFLDNNWGYLVMYSPGFAGLIASRVNHEQFPCLGLKMCPIKYLMIGFVTPIIAWGLSYISYWIFVPGATYSGFRFTKMLILDIPINIFFALGEEIGWRGFWAPVMTAKFGYLKASIYIGIIWSLWHSPTFLERYYYSGATIPFVLSTVALSIIMNYFRLKTGSIWPAVMIHAAENYIQGVLDPFTFGPQKVYLIGPCGILTTGLLALTAILFLFYTKKDPDLAPYKKGSIEIEHKRLT